LVHGPTGNYADTDGDEWADALFYDTCVKNEDGQTYHAAVRIIDLSGLLNVNTAAGDSGTVTMPPITSPVHITLSDWLLHGHYSDVHAERCGATGTIDLNDLDKFYHNCAWRVLQPVAPYLPFAIGDEMHLRWLSESDWAVRAGRFYDKTRAGDLPLPESSRRFLTTWNCSRSLPRNPNGSDFTQALVLHDPDDPERNLLTNSDHRQNVYKRMKLMLTELGLGGTENDRERMAAHFVSNLWAYMSTEGSVDTPFEFSPEGTFTVYGLTEPEVVITEAYVKARNDGAGDRENEVHALELMSVSDSTDLSNYELLLAGTSTPIPLSGMLAAGGKEVFYTIIDDSDTGFLNLDGSVSSTDTDVIGAGVGLNLTQDIWLFKTVGATKVPIDIFKASQLGYTPLEEGEGYEDAQAEKDIRRDDDPDEPRYLVAEAFKLFEGSGNQLGQANGVSGEPDIALEAPYPVRVWLKDAALQDIGETRWIFFAGPHKDASDNYTPFTRAICEPWFLNAFPKDKLARGRFDFCVEDVNTGGFSPGTYPDIPYATTMGEFFTLIPGDTTRTPDERTYGRINVNTAPEYVLQFLPFPPYLDNEDGSYAIDLVDAIDSILAYRDLIQKGNSPNYQIATRESICGVSGLRASPGSQVAGFLSPGEAAIPLADYAETVLAGTVTESDADYLELRDSLYRAVSNLITVNSDVFAVNIRIQLREDQTDKVKGDWYYVAVIDRSNCRKRSDTPAVLLFSQVE